MFKPESMEEITLVVKNGQLKKAIRLLADAKAVHVKAHKELKVGNTLISSGEPDADAESLAHALTVTRNLLSKIQGGGTAEPCTLAERLDRIQRIADEYSAHEQRLLQLGREAELLSEKKDTVALLPKSSDPIDTLFRAKTVHVALYAYTPRSEFGEIRKRNPLFSEKNTDARTMLAGFKENPGDIPGFERIDIDALRGIDGTPAAALASLNKKEQSIRSEAERERQAMLACGMHRTFLEETEHVLALELAKAQAPILFGRSSAVSLVRGYVPVSEKARLTDSLGALDAVIEFSHAKEAPTKLNNPPVARNFEELMQLYTLPKYKEIDPTSIMAVTFPVFFGFMLGDIGYGLALLALFITLRTLKPDLKRFFDIVIVSAVSTIAFGFVFGEFFGAEELLGLHLPHLIHRTGETELMFLIAMMFGIVHLNLGLVLGMINEAKHHSLGFALASKGGWMVLQLAAAMLAAAYGLLPFAVPKALAWFALGIAVTMIAATEKLQGLFELPMIFSHILSYARLVAIGMASVYLAVVVNDLGSQLVHVGGFAIVAGVLVVIVGHVVNLALGLLGPFLHSLRLHYAEFFMKFYAGGGTPYKPFGVVNATR